MYLTQTELEIWQSLHTVYSKILSLKLLALYRDCFLVNKTPTSFRSEFANKQDLIWNKQLQYGTYKSPLLPASRRHWSFYTFAFLQEDR